MTPEQFVYWLRGYAELNPNTPPTHEQWKIIQDHLNLVFIKETPDRSTPPPFSPIQPGDFIPPLDPYIPDPYKVIC